MAIFGRKGHEHRHEAGPALGKFATKNRIALILAIIAIVLILYYAVFLTVNQRVVNAPAVANITHSGTIFSVNSQQYLISLAGVNSGAGLAYIHISKLPIFVNPLLNVTLNLGNITKINAGTYYADMGVQMQSMGQNSITIKVSPLFTSLQIVPDASKIKVVQGTLYNSGQQHGGASSTITVSSTTTAPSSSSTTIPAVNSTALAINQTVVQSQLYSLMMNFSVLYANTSKCTASLYSTTYYNAHGTIPTGQNSYDNVSQIVPYNMYKTVTYAGNGNYNVNFVTKDYSIFNNKVAATVVVNVSRKVIAYENISNTGIFSGETLTQLGQAYIVASSEGACGVYV